MEIVEKIKNKGHINEKLVKALKEVKSLGNDGAHVNENEPDMKQINTAKNLIDNFLQSTILQDINIKKLKTSKNKTNKKSNVKNNK